MDFAKSQFEVFLCLFSSSLGNELQAYFQRACVVPSFWWLILSILLLVPANTSQVIKVLESEATCLSSIAFMFSPNSLQPSVAIAAFSDHGEKAGH